MASTESSSSSVSPAPNDLLARYEQIHRQIAATLAKDVFFIVGCQKSGTTWLEHLLDGHPQVVCRGEAVFVPVLLPAMRHMAGTFNKAIRDRNAQVGTIGTEMLLDESQLDFLFLTAAGSMMSRWDRYGSARVIGEKTPEHAVTLRHLVRYFPRAKVIHIIRDGRDVAVSGWFHNLRQSGDSFRQRFPDMPSYIRYLVRGHWLPYIHYARAFGAAAPDRYFELRYEDLHSEPEPVIGRMLQFLGVDDGQAEVDACLQAGRFERLSSGRKAGDESRSSFFRKGVIGDWQNHFDAAATAAFMQDGGALLKQLGYDADPAPVAKAS